MDSNRDRVETSDDVEVPSPRVIYGGTLGTNSGVAARLAATDPRLVPYGVMAATFNTGLGCLVGPSVLFLVTRMAFSA